MAGHSKWKNIRIRKGKQDALRGNLFTKLSREITVAAKSGGGDPGMNPRLRVAVDKAKEASVPKDNIDRAIKKGTGEIAGVSYEEIVYEGTGPGGSGIILQCYTENRNRTVGEVRDADSKRRTPPQLPALKVRHLRPRGIHPETNALMTVEAGSRQCREDPTPRSSSTPVPH